MASTNLSLARHLNGNPVLQSEIKLGLRVFFPSGAGGVLEHKCISLNTSKAEFYSTNPEWPVGYAIQFNRPDFSLAEFQCLHDALHSYNSCGGWPTSEQRSIVNRAHELGYALQLSYTQATWTENGVNAYKNLKERVQSSKDPL